LWQSFVKAISPSVAIKALDLIKASNMKVSGTAQHTLVHFGDESFQAISCSGTLTTKFKINNRKTQKETTNHKTNWLRVRKNMQKQEHNKMQCYRRENRAMPL